ncbi:MAG TPA: hypothetical protein VMB21_03530 [Candidatus Limnocylindria bacterium]|nr:hypothetical protein [Candidatus Limnocylindria bacterium]
MRTTTLLILLLTMLRAGAWDYELHRLVNEIALASLPTNFPAFVREPAAHERVAFLAGEPDRWRNVPDVALRHINAPEHFLDLEDLTPYGLTPTNLSALRYEFVAQLAVIRAQDPSKFPGADPAKDTDRNRWLPGLLPWRITEDYAKLKSVFSYLKTFEQHGGTPEEIANAQADAIYVMGVMGHFVGDAAQPLHTTHNYNGWTMANPHGYTTNRTFHGWIDGGYIRKVGLERGPVFAQVRPAKSAWDRVPGVAHDSVFPVAMAFLNEQFGEMEKTYQMEKDGRLSGNGEKGLEGRAFIQQQVLRGGQMLGDLWLTAWESAPVDTYLRSQLAQRNGDSPAPKK